MTDHSQKAQQDATVDHSNVSADDDNRVDAAGLTGEKTTPLVSAILVSLYVAVAGGVLVGIGEFMLTVLFSAAPSHGGWWPTDLVLAAGGRTVATYLLFSLPTMLGVGLVYWLLSHRRRPAAPEALFPAVYLLLVTLIAFPAWVDLVRRVNTKLTIPGLVLGITLAALLFSRLHRVQQRVGTRRLRHWHQIAAGVAGLVALGLGSFFVRSPLLNPGTFRVAEGASTDHVPQSPNVLWVVFDTMRADRMGVYGYDQPTTPFLDRWAEQALVFDRVVADGMWTIPSHTSMFTGLSVRQHGMGGPITRLDDSRETVAEILSKNGYKTALFSNNPLVGPPTNLSQGFETTRVPWEFVRELRCGLDYFCERWGIAPPVSWMDTGIGSALTNELVARWLDRQSDAPVFVFVNYMEAHLPYLATKNYRRRFLPPAGVRRSYELRRHAYGEIADFLTFEANIDGYDRVLPSDREVLKRMYDASVRNLDARVEELIEIFQSRGLLDNTLVVITADHGEHLETHDMWSHHFLLYDDLIHVPMIIRPPGGEEPRRIATVVQLSDLYPTVLHAALGATEVDTGSDARDLLAIAQSDTCDRIAVAHTFGSRPEYVDRLLQSKEPRVRHLAFAQTAVVNERFKYMLSRDETQELYDTIVDPGELDNRAQASPRELLRLEEYLELWCQKTPEYVAPQDDSSVVDPEVMNLLQGLGYVQEKD